MSQAQQAVSLDIIPHLAVGSWNTDKKENKFSSYIRKFRWDLVLSHI
jgi:hypothetical protein